MKQITSKLCQQIPAHIDLLHYIKEDNSSQPGKDIENSNMPLIQDIKNSIRIMFKEEINRGIAELKNVNMTKAGNQCGWDCVCVCDMLMLILGTC